MKWLWTWPSPEQKRSIEEALIIQSVSKSFDHTICKRRALVTQSWKKCFQNTIFWKRNLIILIESWAVEDNICQKSFLHRISQRVSVEQSGEKNLGSTSVEEGLRSSKIIRHEGEMILSISSREDGSMIVKQVCEKDVA